MRKIPALLIVFLQLFEISSVAQQAAANVDFTKRMDKMAETLLPKIIGWRRDFHQHPELSNREFRTAEKISAHLKSLGIETTTGIAKTGVIGILKGGKPGPVVALRADMDALPVAETNNLPYKSTVTTDYKGQPTSVMHACGHDTHVAMLMGVAEILVAFKKELQGTVKFIFQPAEEGPPAGEEGGAKLMVKENALENPKVDVIFGQHISSGELPGIFSYRPGGANAENDIFSITIHGKQNPWCVAWSGVDPIVTGSQIVLALQTIISRNVPLTDNAAVITVGAFHAGNRQNIIPADAVIIGTVRTLDTIMRNTIHQRIREVVKNIAASAGASAEVDISMEDAMLYNDPRLTAEMLPTLRALAGQDKVQLVPAAMGSEDFAYFSQKVPGFYFHIGALPKGMLPENVEHHTPGFQIDEAAMIWGVRAFCHLTVDYMSRHPTR